MELDHNKIYAVIAGDVIGSSKLEKPLREELLLTMKSGSETLHAAYPDAIPFPIDIYAGDSWQLLVTQPSMALRAAIFFRAFLIEATNKKADTRMVISLGKIDFISQNRISESDGEAFRNAGKFLKETTSKQNMNLVAPSESLTTLWNCSLGLLDVIIRHWTAKQARAASGAVRGLSLTEIAAFWTPPLKHPTVSFHLKQAGWDAIEKTIELYEERLNHTIGV